MPHRLLSYSVLAVAATGGVGGLYVHRLLDRPGETALGLVPANAFGVVTLDLVPAPDQVLAFKHIDETISAATGGKGSIDSFVESIIDNPKLKPLAAQVGRSVAFAWLPTAGKPKPEDGDGVALIALKDAAAFSKALAAAGKPVAVPGAKAYSLSGKGDTPMMVMVIDDYAVVSDKAWPLAAVQAVVGGAPALPSVAAFADARKEALPSSNLLVLISPEALKNADLGKGNEWKGHEWIVTSMAVREKGMEFAANIQTDDPKLAAAASVKPLGSAFLDAMPRGAYGFFALAGPGKSIEGVIAQMGKEIDEPTQEIKKETDLDLRSDILPALGGNAAIGFYPSITPEAGIDLLVSVDDANGADPAALAHRLESVLDREAAKDKSMKGPWKVDLPLEGAQASRLADEPTQELQKGAKEAERSFFRPLTLSKGKTVAWATVGNSVLLATSKDLLTRAVEARRAPSAAVGLSGDTAFGTTPATMADGQFSMAVSMSRLAEGLRNTIDPSHMSPEAATYYRRTLSLFDATTEPLAARTTMAPGGHYRSFTSIPLDWSKLPSLFVPVRAEKP